MSKRIKGITIELDGSTKGLDKALSNVNKRSRDVQKELRDVDRLLKFNPKDVDLVAQKQKLLGDQVEATKDKLGQLKDAESQVQEQFKRGEIGEEQYRAFQREIVETESKLKHYSSQLKNVERDLNSLGSSMQNAGKKMKEFGDKTTSIGKSVATKVTTPILGIGLAAAKIGSDFEASMSKVAAVSGATGSDLDDLTNKARDLGATTQFSASEAAEALNYMALAGWETHQMLDGIDGVMALAAASGEDLGRVSDIVTDGLSAFGLAAEDSARFADVLAATSANANTDVSMLGKAFEYVGPVAGALGYEIEDVSKAIGIMSNAGIKGEKAGTALRTMMTNLAKPTSQMSDAMEELGISLTDSEGQMKSFDEIMLDLRGSFEHLTEAEQASAAATIFGKEAMSGALAIINATNEDYEKLSKSVNNASGSAEEMAKIINDNLQGRLKEMKSALEEAAIAIYDNLQPALESAIKFVKNLADWFNNLSPRIQNTIVLISGLMAALGPLLIVLGVFASSIGSIITVAGKLIPIMGGVGKVLTVVRTAVIALTGPIGIAIAAITALVAAGVYVYKNWDKVSATASSVWDAITNIISNSVQRIIGIFQNLKDINLVQVGKDIINGLINGILSKIKNVKDAALSVASGVKNAITGFFAIRSPSKLTEELGEYVTEGLARGIKNKTKSAVDAAKKLSEEVKKSFDLSMGWIDDQKYFEKISTEEELKILESLYDKYKDHAEQRMKLEREIFRAKKDIEKEGFEHSKEWIDERKYYNELSLEEELQAWGRMQSRYVRDTEERKQIDRELYRVQKEINEKRKEDLKKVQESYKEMGDVVKSLSKIEKGYYEDISKALSEYEKNVKNTRKSLKEDMEKARKDYESSVRSINEQLIESEKSVTREYNNELKQRTRSLVDFVGIFNEVTEKDISGEKLMENLQGQVDAFTDWQKNISNLSKRGIDKSLLEELRDMGPASGSEIAALNELSDSELSKYVSLWKEKQKLAKSEAVNQLSKQRAEMNQKLQDIRLDAQKQLQNQSHELQKNLQDMRNKANSELEKYKLDWLSKNEEIKKNAEEEIRTINDKYNELTGKSTKYGIDMVSNFIDGAKSQFGRLQSTMEQMTQMIDNYMPHSPAKVGPLKRLGEWGPALVETFADGIKGTIPALKSSVENMSMISSAALSTPSLGSNSTENNYGGNVININMPPGTPRDQVDEIMRELHKRGVKF